LLWNEGERRLYGYSPDEVIGKANFVARVMELEFFDTSDFARTNTRKELTRCGGSLP